MKKRILLTALLLLPIGLFSSCSKTKKINVDSMMDVDSFIFITKDEMVDLISHQRDFIVVVGESGCSTCDIIKPVISNYIKKYNRIVYWIENSSYQECVNYFINDQDYALKAAITSSTILLFDDGKTYKQIDYDANLYYSENQLDQKLSKYVTKSNYILLNDINNFSYNETFTMYRMDYETETNLYNLIQGDEKVNVLYSWKDCNDCKELKEAFLDSYLLKNNISLYEYEVYATRGLKNDDGTPNLISFKEFASRYEFASYRDGKVPTIVSYQKGNKVDMKVFSNDVLEEENGQYVVKTSFYPALVNKTNKDKLALHNELINYEIEEIKKIL